jgi:hypothetical protein
MLMIDACLGLKLGRLADYTSGPIHPIVLGVRVVHGEDDAHHRPHISVGDEQPPASVRYSGRTLSSTLQL